MHDKPPTTATAPKSRLKRRRSDFTKSLSFKFDPDKKTDTKGVLTRYLDLDVGDKYSDMDVSNERSLPKARRFSKLFGRPIPLLDLSESGSFESVVEEGNRTKER